MKLLDDYSKLQKEIYDYFGYKEDYVAIPIDDQRECFWILDEDAGFVKFAKTKEKFDTDGDYCQNEIYTQGVYRGEDFTMICVDTHTNGNKFLQVFSNSKEVKLLTGITYFKKELTDLINRCCIENSSRIPDFLLAELVTGIIVNSGSTFKKILEWHGCDSVCHPKSDNQCDSVCHPKPDNQPLEEPFNF